MDKKRLGKCVPLFFLVGILAALSSSRPRGVSADQIQLRNDNNAAAGYNVSWRAGDSDGAVLTPEASMYPVRVLSVEFSLYIDFSGANDPVAVRVCIYSLLNGSPDTQLGCSNPTTITEFFPHLVSISLPSEIVIRSPDSFAAAVEYVTGEEGTTPLTLTDSNTSTPQGIDFFSKDGGNTWFEHYDFWQDADPTDFNIIRATVDTNYGSPTAIAAVMRTPLRAATRTPTTAPTPIPRATPFPCDPSWPENGVFLPLVVKQLQGGPNPRPSLPAGFGVLGVKDYWTYASMVAGDHQLLVNLSNGNLLVSYVDLISPAPGIDSLIQRSYNALSSYKGEFGRGWASNVGNTMRLGPQTDGSVALFGPSGEIEIFRPQPGGFASPPGFHYTLQQHPDGSYTLTSIADGIKASFSSERRITSVVDRNGNTQSYHRDAAGNVYEIIDSAGQRTTISYNASNLVTRIIDRAGRISQYSYDPAERLTQFVNPAGSTTAYRYDACGSLIELVDVRGNTWAFGYDRQGRVVLITDPLGDVTQFTYQEDTTIVTDANGHNTIHHFDADGKVQELFDANGHSVRFTWDQFFNVTSVTSSLNHQTQFSWDGNTGLLTAASDPLGNTVSYTYDANHNLSSITDARGNVTRFSYDATGANLLKATQADGGETTITYDGRGDPLTVTDPNGNARDPSNPTGIPYSFSYNAYGFPTDAYDALGNHWTYTWDNGAANLKSVRDAKGQLTRYTYDVLDRMTSITYDDGTWVGFDYDAVGNLIGMQDSQGTTTYTYDEAGQLRSEDDPRTAGAIRYDYDAVGNLITITRENGAVLAFNYDPADRLISQSNPFDGGQLVRYRYDADDRLLDIFYPNGDQTTYSYHDNDWLESLLTTAADGTIYNQYNYPSQAEGGYDGNGNPLRFTRTFAMFDAQGNLDWTTETWRMQYDAMDQLLQQNGYDAGDVWQWRVRLEYNPNGLWSTRSYQDDTQFQSWDYHYDAAARWTGITFWDGRRDVVINDANGNQTQILEEFFATKSSSRNADFSTTLLKGIPDQPSAPVLLGPLPEGVAGGVLSVADILTHTTTFEYDVADRLSRVTDPVGNWFTFEFDGYDRIITIDSNGFSVPKHQYYDLLGMASETQDATVVNYLYDLAGNVRANQVEGLPCQYLHRDSRGQITHISGGSSAHYGSGSKINQNSIQPRAFIDYCFMGNVQASGASSGGAVYEPFLSTGRYAIPLQGTWQAGILYVGGGQSSGHNAQVHGNNRIVAEAAAGSLQPIIASTFYHYGVVDLLIDILFEEIADYLGRKLADRIGPHNPCNRTDDPYCWILKKIWDETKKARKRIERWYKMKAVDRIFEEYLQELRPPLPLPRPVPPTRLPRPAPARPKQHFNPIDGDRLFLIAA